MKCAVEIGSGAMICIPSLIKIGSGIEKLNGGAQTHRQHGDRISLLLFFQNKESRLKCVTFNLSIAYSREYIGPIGTEIKFARHRPSVQNFLRYLKSGIAD
jgi:hypothetical protein